MDLLRVIAKKTLLKTAMKAGFKPKPSSRKQKYVIQGGPHDSRTLPSPGRTPSVGFDGESDRPCSLYEDDLSSNLLPFNKRIILIFIGIIVC